MFRADRVKIYNITHNLVYIKLYINMVYWHNNYITLSTNLYLHTDYVLIFS